MLNFNLILVPTDLSQYSLRALDYAAGLAQQFQSHVKVIYVHEPVPTISDMAWQGDIPERERESVSKARKSLDEILVERVPSDVSVETIVVSGNAVSKIIGEARKSNADLIVMATHGRTGLKHVVMGSTTEAVIRRAPCPVLALKQPMAVAAESTSP